MKKSSRSRENMREKIIGLGKDSIHKSYYPQLQKHIEELEKQKNEVEKKNNELLEAIQQLNETKEQLTRSEEKFRTLFENAHDAIFILDQNGIVIDFNEQALISFNTERKYLINHSANDLSADIQPDGRLSAEVAAKHFGLVLRGVPQVLNWLFVNHRGERIYTRVAMNRITIEGQTYLHAVVRDITNEKKLERELLSATIKTEENERARFAKELHDGLGPILSTIKLYFQWLSETDDAEQRKIIIDKGNNNIVEAIKTIKEVSNNLSPHVLLNYGLVEGLKQFIEVISEIGKIEVSFKQNLSSRFDQEIELTLYRIITELINNTIKHAEATKIDINLYVVKNVLKVTFKDNGKGCEITNLTMHKTGFGISNMKNRIQNIGGLIKFSTQPGHGFKANISLNLEEH